MKLVEQCQKVLNLRAISNSQRRGGFVFLIQLGSCAVTNSPSANKLTNPDEKFKIKKNRKTLKPLTLKYDCGFEKTSHSASLFEAIPKLGKC